MLTHIWVEETNEKTVDEKMTAYYLKTEQAEKDVFRFWPQKMSYELMYHQIFAEFLCPSAVYDLIDYHLRECLKRESKMRRCKNWLFAVTGHGGTEYCNRPADERGTHLQGERRIPNVGKNKSTDEAFKVFHRKNNIRNGSPGLRRGASPRRDFALGVRESGRNGTSTMREKSC